MERLAAILRTKLARKLLALAAILISGFLTKKLGISVGPDELNEFLELAVPVLIGGGVDQVLKVLNVRAAEKAGQKALEAAKAEGLVSIVDEKKL